MGMAEEGFSGNGEFKRRDQPDGDSSLATALILGGWADFLRACEKIDSASRRGP
jgi:hypothetical protein